VAVIRRYADGRVRFLGEEAELERLAVRAIIAERRSFEDRLHAAHLAMLGETEPPGGTHQVTHVVGDEAEEALWRAWRAYGG
jgi:hypothetical protein